MVEAEKTALIGAGFIPEYNWLATGGMSGVNDLVNILQGKKILIFPDVDAYDYWKNQVTIYGICMDSIVNLSFASS